jgi:hypothetical protein
MVDVVPTYHSSEVVAPVGIDRGDLDVPLQMRVSIGHLSPWDFCGLTEMTYAHSAVLCQWSYRHVAA